MGMPPERPDMPPPEIPMQYEREYESPASRTEEQLLQVPPRPPWATGGPDQPGMPTPPGGWPGQPTQPARPAAPPQPKWQMSWLRVELITEKGPAVAEMRELKPAAPLLRGWHPISIPLSAFQGPGKDGAQVQRMIISGDRHDIFFIGEIKVAEDRAPMWLNVVAQPVVVKAGSRVNLTAKLRAGMAAVRVSWDFGEDGQIRDEAYGEKVVQIYPKSGNYTVTCTASDLDGIKKSVSKTIEIKVL